jgi:hypothetical protein
MNASYYSSTPGFMDFDESFSHHRTHLASAQVLRKDAPDECRVHKQPSIITKSISATVDDGCTVTVVTSSMT